MSFGADVNGRARDGRHQSVMALLTAAAMIVAGPLARAVVAGPAGAAVASGPVIVEYPVSPSESSLGVDPRQITAGPGGNLWFTEQVADKIGRITPSGTITEFPLPTGNAGPARITAGPDGNLWFTEQNANQIAVITPPASLASQTITFNSTPPSPADVGGSYAMSATGGGSGNAVVFSIDAASSAGACTISGSTAQLTGAGTCVIDANQAGSAGYAAAGQVQQSFSVIAPSTGPNIATVVDNGPNHASTPAPGDPLTIDGAGFGQAQGAGTVDLLAPPGSTTAPVTLNVVSDWTDTSIDVTLPQALTVGNAYLLGVSTASGQKSNTVPITLSVAITPPTPPAAMALPAGQPTTVFVSDATGNSVSVLDAKTNTVAATIPVGSDPQGLAVTPDGARVLVSDTETGSAGAGNTLYWWSGQSWQVVSGQSVARCPPTCITTTFDATSAPDLAQLTGTVFAVGRHRPARPRPPRPRPVRHPEAPGWLAPPTRAATGCSTPTGRSAPSATPPNTAPRSPLGLALNQPPVGIATPDGRATGSSPPMAGCSPSVTPASSARRAPPWMSPHPSGCSPPPPVPATPSSTRATCPPPTAGPDAQPLGSSPE
ncbi:MAG: virginiamycin B lyase family protein [Acidimicrobiales bacterium]